MRLINFLNMNPHKKLALLASSALLALTILIGCGGGGGSSATGSLTTGSSGGTTSLTTGTSGVPTTGSTSATTGSTGSTATGTTGSTTTGSTATGTTGSTTTGTTGSTTTGSTGSTTTGSTGSTTTGGTTGVLPSNVLIYNFPPPPSNSLNVHSINPNGTNDTLIANYNSTQVQLICPDPQIANGYIVALSNNQNNTSYDLYFTTISGGTISSTGATRLTNQNFGQVYSLQVSQDGTHIIVVAGQANSVSATLYAMSFSDSNNNPVVTNFNQLDSADGAYLAENGTSICYTKMVNGLGQIFTININGSGQNQVTTDNADHTDPQFDKTSANLCWAQTTPGSGVNGQYDIWVAQASGTNSHQVTNVGSGNNAATPCFSPNGSTLGFVFVNTTTVANSGIYTISTNGTNTTSVVLNPQIWVGLYWTNNNGSGFGPFRSAPVPLGGSDLHILRLMREGRWP